MRKKIDECLELRLQEYEHQKPENLVSYNAWIPAFAGMTDYFNFWQSHFINHSKVYRH